MPQGSVAEPATAPREGALARLLPERALEPEARGEYVREYRALMRARVRAWGLVLLLLQGAFLAAATRFPAHDAAQLLWRRDLVRIHTCIELCDVVLVACVFFDRGAARWVADRVGAALQLVALFAYALIAVNAQRLHGAVGPYAAMIVVVPFLFRASTTTYLASLAGSVAVALAGIALVQPVAAVRATNLLTLTGMAVFGAAVAQLYHASLVRDLGNRRALRALNRDLEARVEAQTRELRAFALRLDDVLETERRRLARDLHDELGQDLTALRFEVAALEARAHTGPEREALTRMNAALDRSQASVRGILESLRPRILDEEGLEEALRWLAGQLQRHSATACDVTVALYDEPPAPVGLAAFRIAQEALTNIARHAGASRAWVTLDSEGDDALRLRVEDNGPRGDGAAIAPGRGVTGMRERALGVGGALEVGPREGGGTRVFARLPLRGAGAPGARGVP